MGPCACVGIDVPAKQREEKIYMAGLNYINLPKVGHLGKLQSWWREMDIFKEWFLLPLFTDDGGGPVAGLDYLPSFSLIKV